MIKKSLVLISVVLALFSCKEKAQETAKTQKQETQLRQVFKAAKAPIIDGKDIDSIWQHAKSYPIDQLWLGDTYADGDFEGYYKLSWTEDALYALVEIKDDSIFEQHANPLKLWWDDDCVEVFIDENNSGGEHQYNHNAFAYHVALDGNVVDMSPKEEGHLYSNHVLSKHITTGNTTLWEMKISIYDSSYQDDKKNTPIKLSAEKKVGFAIAYCDNDGSEERENFIGSIAIEGNDKNRGWIDASVFGTIQLKN